MSKRKLNHKNSKKALFRKFATTAATTSLLVSPLAPAANAIADTVNTTDGEIPTEQVVEAPESELPAEIELPEVVEEEKKETETEQEAEAAPAPLVLPSVATMLMDSILMDTTDDETDTFTPHAVDRHGNSIERNNDNPPDVLVASGNANMLSTAMEFKADFELEVFATQEDGGLSNTHDALITLGDDPYDNPWRWLPLWNPHTNQDIDHGYWEAIEVFDSSGNKVNVEVTTDGNQGNFTDGITYTLSERLEPGTYTLRQDRGHVFSGTNAHLTIELEVKDARVNVANGTAAVAHGENTFTATMSDYGNVQWGDPGQTHNLEWWDFLDHATGDGAYWPMELLDAQGNEVTSHTVSVVHGGHFNSGINFQINNVNGNENPLPAGNYRIRAELDVQGGTFAGAIVYSDIDLFVVDLQSSETVNMSRANFDAMTDDDAVKLAAGLSLNGGMTLEDLAEVTVAKGTETTVDSSLANVTQTNYTYTFDYKGIKTITTFQVFEATPSEDDGDSTSDVFVEKEDNGDLIIVTVDTAGGHLRAWKAWEIRFKNRQKIF